LRILIDGDIKPLQADWSLLRMKSQVKFMDNKPIIMTITIGGMYE